MRKIVLSLGIMATLLLSACSDLHQVVRLDNAATHVISPTDPVYIAIAGDGMYGGKIYAWSGQTTAALIGVAVQYHTRLVRVSKEFQSVDDALSSASKRGDRFLIYATIRHWEDRATEWSGAPDRVEVMIELIDVLSGQPVTAAIVKGASGLATLGGDHPQDLLPGPIAEFIDALY